MRSRVLSLLVVLAASTPRDGGSQEVDRREVDVVFALPHGLPERGWRGSIPSFAFIREFNVNIDGTAHVRFRAGDSRWEELDSSDSVEVVLKHDGCAPDLRVPVPKEIFERRGQRVNVRIDEAARVQCRVPGERSCSIEVFEAGSTTPVEGVSITRHGILGKTDVDGRWTGNRVESHLNAELLGDELSRFSFHVGGRRQNQVSFCAKGSPDHAIFYVVPGRTPNEAEEKHVVVLFRPGGKERRVLDGLEATIEFEDEDHDAAIVPLGPDAIAFDHHELFHGTIEKLAASVHLGPAIEIPVEVKSNERDLTKTIKKHLKRGQKGCRLKTLGPDAGEISESTRLYAFGARLKFNAKRGLFIPKWLAGLGARGPINIRISDTNTRPERGTLEIRNIQAACAGDHSRSRWTTPQPSDRWPIHILTEGARTPVAEATVYVSPVSRADECQPDKRDLWAGVSDAAGRVAIGDAAARLVQVDGLCVCAERSGLRGCSFGAQDTLQEITLSKPGP